MLTVCLPPDDLQSSTSCAATLALAPQQECIMKTDQFELTYMTCSLQEEQHDDLLSASTSAATLS